jgi:hypothetical protein
LDGHSGKDIQERLFGVPVVKADTFGEEALRTEINLCSHFPTDFAVYASKKPWVEGY